MDQHEKGSIRIFMHGLAGGQFVGNYKSIDDKKKGLSRRWGVVRGSFQGLKVTPEGLASAKKRVIRPDESDPRTGFLGRFGAKRVKKGSLSMALTLDYPLDCVDYQIDCVDYQLDCVGYQLDCFDYQVDCVDYQLDCWLSTRLLTIKQTV